MSQDLRYVLAKIGQDIDSDNLAQLNFLFFGANEPSANSVFTLFQFLIRDDIINDKNVSRLIDALKAINLPLLAKTLDEYQKRIDLTGVSTGNNVFIGRSDELGDIEAHIDDIKGGGHGVRAVFLTGLPGVGKTYLAEEVCRRENDSFFDPILISCRGLETALSVKNLLLERLCISIDRENLFKILESKLKSTSNKLIILDNLELVMESDGPAFEDLMKNLFDIGKRIRSRSHCFLMTSRRGLSDKTVDDLGDVFLKIVLDKMNEHDSLELVDFYLGGRHLTSEERKQLIKLCGQHTLSMALVTSRLKYSPNVPFNMVAEELKRKPLGTLTHIERCEYIENRSYVECSLESAFCHMDPASQDLLVRLSAAADDIKESTAKQLYRDLSSETRDLFSESLIQLLELNFVKCRTLSLGNESVRRFSIHLLIRSFVSGFCQQPSCSEALKAAYEESRELLRVEYVKDMKRLSQTEWTNPRRYNREMEAERLNFLPTMPQIVDFMTKDKSTLNDLDCVCDVARNLLFSSKNMENFLLERKKYALRVKAPTWILVFFELRYADSIRLSGLHAKAGELFEKLKQDVNRDTTDVIPEQQEWLKAYFNRFYGRYLKDLSYGDSRQASKKAVRYLKQALETFKKQELFADVNRHVADVQNDLGNAYKILGDGSMCDRLYYYNEAKKAFDESRKIFERVNPQMMRLFEVYLSMASCEMELKSFMTSSDGHEDRQSLGSALKNYDKAETIARVNKDIILNDSSRMGYLHYSRAICHLRGRNLTAAYADASKSLRHRLDAFGCHNRTMNCYILLGDIYSRGSTIFVRHNREALNALNKALKVAKRLTWKRADVNKNDLERLDNLFQIVCYRLEMDSKEFEDTIEAIRNKDLLSIEPDNRDNELLSDEDDVDKPSGSIKPSILRCEYRDSSSDSDGDSIEDDVPSCAAARELADQLKQLMKNNLEQLKFLSHVMEITEMEILCAVLRSGYPNMRANTRNARYTKGMELYHQLKRLEDSPALVLEENEKNRKR